jgi:YidC/Oxa1 family membrane protein insertase
MEKRTLIAVILAIAILVAYQYLFVKPASKPPAGPPAPAVETPAPTAPPVEVAPVPSPEGERLITVDTDLYTATLSSVGGTVKSFKLKKYKDSEGKDVSLLDGQGTYPALGIGWKDDFSLSRENFHVTGEDLALDESRQTGSVSFEYAAQGYSIRRTYTFHNGSYLFDLKDETAGLPGYEITLGGDFGIFDRKQQRLSHTGPVLLKESDRIEIKPAKLKEPSVYAGDIKWIAQEDKYFCAAIVPASVPVEARVWKFQDSAVISLQGASGVNDLKVYAGPKELDRLKGLGIGLQHIVDFGFFSILARPIFWLLQLCHKVVGNYGWAIVILTIIVRVPFIPLVNKGQRSMKQLQKLQPRMQELKEKHKNDPQRMQQEMMGLYKKYKVNPLGGCLPMLLQIPVFFALYKVLLVAIELRDAPFMLWITDLSQKDPLYILPIVMGITMLIQQKMTPTAGDPKQQKLMMFMPVIFTFLFLNFASGLVLYWLVNNLLSIGQQIYVNRKKTAESSA